MSALKIPRWQKFQAYYDAVRWAVEADRYYDPHFRLEPVWLETLDEMFHETLMGLVCRLRGHAWEDVSVAGPESGNVALQCKRCGLSDERRLY